MEKVWRLQELIFGKREFCKTCHIADHVQQCYDAGHQIITDGQIFKKNLPSYSIDDSDFKDGCEGKSNILGKIKAGTVSAAGIVITVQAVMDAGSKIVQTVSEWLSYCC